MSSKRPFEVIALGDSDESEDEAPPTSRIKNVWTAGTGIGTFTTPIDLSDDVELVSPVSPDPFRSTRAMNRSLRLTPEGRAGLDQHDARRHNLLGRHSSMTEELDRLGLPSIVPGSYTDAVFDDAFADDEPPMPDPYTEPEYLSEQDGFNRILEMFPDVAHDHARSLIGDNDGSLAQAIEKLVQAANYPKERDRKASAQREKPDMDEDSNISVQDLESRVAGKKRKVILHVLRYDFPKIPVYFIKKTQTEKGAIYAAYMALNEAQHTDPPPYSRAPWRAIGILDFDVIGVSNGVDETVMSDVEKQYNAAKKACEQINAKKRKENAHKKQEEVNAERAMATGAVADCAVCFDECPLNRMVQCSKDSPHTTCFECMLNFIKSEVGQSRCRLMCPDSSGCVGTYTESQLRLVPGDKALLEQLFLLQQEQDIRDAGIDDVESCPFCDYKTVCPPIDVDFELRCEDAECGMTSCRKCRKERHIPDTCDEAAQKRSEDAALYHRHKIEEAMSEALKRNCNKCKKSFVKIDGCNKMTCPGCGNTQCYVCSKDVHGYEHFGRGGCPQMDDVEARHAKEVKEAQEAAQAKVAAENPEVRQESLEIKVSEAVLQAEAATGTRHERYRAAALAARGAQNMEQIRLFHRERERRRAEMLRANNIQLLGNGNGTAGNNVQGALRGDAHARLEQLRQNHREIQNLLARRAARQQDMDGRLGGMPNIQAPLANGLDARLLLHRLQDARHLRRVPTARPRPEPMPDFDDINLNAVPGADTAFTAARWREQLLQRRLQQLAPPAQDFARHDLLRGDGAQALEMPPPMLPDDDWLDHLH